MNGLEHIVILILATQGIKILCFHFKKIKIARLSAVFLFVLVFIFWTIETTGLPRQEYSWFRSILMLLSGFGLYDLTRKFSKRQ